MWQFSSNFMEVMCPNSTRLMRRDLKPNCFVKLQKITIIQIVWSFEACISPKWYPFGSCLSVNIILHWFERSWKGGYELDSSLMNGIKNYQVYKICVTSLLDKQPPASTEDFCAMEWIRSLWSDIEEPVPVCWLWCAPRKVCIQMC